MKSATFLALTKAGLIGWAIDLANPSFHQEYSVEINGVIVGQGRNDGLHDVELTGHPDEKQVRQFGFRIAVSLPPDQQFPLQITLLNSNGVPTSASMVIQSPAGLALDGLYYGEEAYEGMFDGFLNNGVSGWCWNPFVPEHNVIVQISLPDQVIGCTVANIYREDLLLAGKGRGYCSFFASLPAHALRRHPELSLSVLGVGAKLPRASPFVEPTQIERDHPLTVAYDAEVKPSSSEFDSMLRRLNDEFVYMATENKSFAETLAELRRRLEQEEMHRAALQGTVDNLVRAWLEQRDQIRSMQSRLAPQPPLSGPNEAPAKLHPMTAGPAPGPDVGLAQQATETPATVVHPTQSPAPTTVQKPLRSRRAGRRGPGDTDPSAEPAVKSARVT